MLATETFVKLCSIYMVMDAHVSSRQTGIRSGSGLAHARLGTDSIKNKSGCFGVW